MTGPSAVPDSVLRDIGELDQNSRPIEWAAKSINFTHFFKEPMLSLSSHIYFQGAEISPKSDQHFLGARGVYLVEVLVSIAILGLLGAGVATILAGENTALIRIKSANQLEEAVDQDLASINDIAFRMTCCSGSCTTESGRTPPCSVDPSRPENTYYDPGKQNYYFPDSTLDSGGTSINAFTAKCNNGTLVTE